MPMKHITQKPQKAKFPLNSQSIVDSPPIMPMISIRYPNVLSMILFMFI